MVTVNKIRFGAFVREITVQQKQISCNDLVPELVKDAEGKNMPYRPAKLQIRPIDTYRILEPYIKIRLLEQIKAVLPLAIYLIYQSL